MKSQAVCFLLGVLPLLACSQNGGSAYQQPPIVLKRVQGEITIDGTLSEADWFRGRPAKGFWEQFPSDSIRSGTETEIYMAFDDDYLYIGAICYSEGDQYITESLRRDYSAGDGDNITFVIDPFTDNTNAFVFGMNAFGVRREALIANGGENPGADWDGGWDNKWQGASAIHDGYWSCELAIPYSTLRYPEGRKEWNFNAYRFDFQSNTRTSWNRIPQNQPIMSLAYMQKMKWEEPPKKPGSNISVIPYVAAAYNQNFEEGTGAVTDFNLGGDAKIGISPSLNLDLTFNPDFSQVEVDRQVLNLSRFEIFFPERRQFFLENADLFGTFGDGRINPFFSRRIGIAEDTAGNNIQVPIYYGARLSGKLNTETRIGLLNMQTAQDSDNLIPGANYTVAALQRRVFGRSNAGLIFVNQENFAFKSDTVSMDRSFDRVLGFDYNLLSKSNKWNGKAFYHQQLTPGNNNGRFAHGARLQYIVRDFSWSWEHQWIGENYDPEVGFVPRRDFFQINPRFDYFTYPGSSINQNTFSLVANILWRPGLGRTDHEIRLRYAADFLNTSRLRVNLTNNYIFLTEAFDPTRTDSEPLPASAGYNFTEASIFYQTDTRPAFSFDVGPRVGQFFNGWRYGISAGINYRFQQYANLELNVNYNYIDLPEPFASAGLFLIGPRLDLTFTRSVFLTTFMQYNSQSENFNINTRLQWRFAPVSDFFLVYTDNYGIAEGLKVNNRAIVAKVTYWLNL